MKIFRPVNTVFSLLQGCLAPVKVVIPPASVLDPTETAAVVGGNVLTSQRVVDVVLKAFEVCAASQVSEKSRVMSLALKCLAHLISTYSRKA